MEALYLDVRLISVAGSLVFPPVRLDVALPCGVQRSVTFVAVGASAERISPVRMRSHVPTRVAPRLLIILAQGRDAMSRFDEPEARLFRHRRAGVWRGVSGRRCQHIWTPYERPRLRLVSSRRPAPGLFGMHPALPSTLVFAALSFTALAVAAVIDVANAVARTALTVSARLRTTRLR